MASPFFFDNITSAASLDENNVVTAGKEGTFAAWPFRGAVSTERTQILRSTTFRAKSTEDCDKTLVSNFDFDPKTEFCTGPISGILSGDIAACDGNLGSPFFSGARGQETVYGILIDTPSPCNAEGQPTGLFARVSSYAPWINANINQS